MFSSFVPSILYSILSIAEFMTTSIPHLTVPLQNTTKLNNISLLHVISYRRFLENLTTLFKCIDLCSLVSNCWIIVHDELERKKNSRTRFGHAARCSHNICLGEIRKTNTKTKFSHRDVKLVITTLEYRGVESKFSAPSICTSDKCLRSYFLKKKNAVIEFQEF